MQRKVILKPPEYFSLKRITDELDDGGRKSLAGSLHSRVGLGVQFWFLRWSEPDDSARCVEIKAVSHCLGVGHNDSKRIFQILESLENIAILDFGVAPEADSFPDESSFAE